MLTLHLPYSRALRLSLTLTLVAALASETVSAQARGDWSTPRPLVARTAPDGVRYVPDELILTCSDAGDFARVTAEVERLGARVIGGSARGRLLQVLLPAGEDALASAASFGNIGGVELAELNGVGQGGALPLVPNDTHFGTQWHLRNTSSNPGTVGADIEAVPAWDIQTGSPDVVVAILDSGIDFAHPEFAGRTLPGTDFVNGDNDPTADHPHGILVTGLAAANADNGFGVAGVDHACTILPVKVLNANNAGTTFNLIQGINYAASERAEIISMSLINYPGAAALLTALADARDDGCILIACAGNGGIGNADTSFPGAAPTTITIGASTSTDARAGFSGTGAALDFIAPGSSVRTVSLAHTDGSSLFSGCSAATPVAAGIVALLKAEFPLLTHDMAYELLRLGAEDQVGPGGEDTPGRDDFFGHGRLNARASLEAMSPCPALLGCYCTPSIPNSTGQSATLAGSGSFVVSDDELAFSAELLPPNQIGYFLMGMGQNSVIPPGSSGPLCILGNGLVRILPPVLDSGPSGTFTHAPGTTGLPSIGSIAAGETWNFQAWFRDVGTSNTTDALSITFQ